MRDEEKLINGGVMLLSFILHPYSYAAAEVAYEDDATGLGDYGRGAGGGARLHHRARGRDRARRAEGARRTAGAQLRRADQRPAPAARSAHARACPHPPT